MTWHTGFNFHTSVCVGESRWTYDNHKHNFWHHLAMVLSISTLNAIYFTKETMFATWFDTPVLIFRHRCVSVKAVELTITTNTIILTPYMLWVGEYLCWMQYILQKKQCLLHDLTHRSKFSDTGVCRWKPLNLRLQLRQLLTHSVYEWVIIMLDAILLGK